MIRILAILLALLELLVFFHPAAQAKSGEKLLKIVALSRHGVRSPTQPDKLLQTWSRKTWPEWPVKKGDLTPRGAALISAMWMQLGGQLKNAGLLPGASCPAQGLVHVRADTDERTRATAAALLEGLAPGCGLQYAVADKSPDPLFHPVKAGLYTFYPIPTVMDILNMIHGDLNALQDEFMGILNLLNKIAGPPEASLCIRYAENADCNITDLPNAVSVSPDGKNVEIIGSLDIASSMAEIFLLEYAEWPNSLAGWGQVNTDILKQILPVHSKIFDIVNRAPLVARARGSSLLREMEEALLGIHSISSLNEAKLVIFVGHDTNIASVGGLIGAEWRPKGFPDNSIPPGALLTMELWENNGRREVRLRFYAQTLEALHSELPPDFLNGETEIDKFTPSQNPVSVLPVVGEARLGITEFQKLVNKVTKGAPLAPEDEKIHEEKGMPAVSE